MSTPKRFSRDANRGTQRRTTDAFQLATTVLYQSPLQHFGLAPNNLQEQPAHVIDFVKRVPCVWDETRFVDGYPGKFVVLARRAGQQWYVVATHAGKERQELAVALPWLSGATLTMLHDQPDRVGPFAGRRACAIYLGLLVFSGAAADVGRDCADFTLHHRSLSP